MTDFIPDDFNAYPGVVRYDVIEHIPSEINFLLRLRIEFSDASVLFTHERVQKGVLKYSYHWQSANNEAIARWDNAPHYRTLASFPHHRHDYQSGTEIISDSYGISLTEVLDHIQHQLNNAIE